MWRRAFSFLLPIVALLAVASTPAAAADGVPVTVHVTCRSNDNHYTASDITYDSTTHVVSKVTWNTNAAFRADRITWAGWGTDGWVVVAQRGGDSDTHDDVDPSGTITTGIDQTTGLSFFRISVWDANWGDCHSGS
ncbi:hypothetical protein [Cryptosporangium phraense]|uniref:Secreted protein n=1 Tax=Cryptosporangium phraense TaxID=2593070 RepID=A0A545AHM4_9ACTN|nr:hypothetical protein [Cryptosporangium phraense]TQS40832.1 hypothetical protein FL583_32620 [Cryptosporangium phraense]